MATSKSVTRSDTVASLLEPEKTLEASRALLAHLKSESSKKAANSEKKSLLVDDDEGSTGEIPVWLSVTTKRHLVDSKDLKPTKIPVPFPLETDSQKSICLIVADPQRLWKNMIASDEFPIEVRKRVSRIIDLGKLKKKFTSYESQRALYAEHDIFLGDTRIINRLPGILGKTFYKNQKKRPVPIEIQQRIPKVQGKRVKNPDAVNACTPIQLAGEIERAVGAAILNLSASTNHAVKIGYASWKAEELAANVERVVIFMVKKLPGGWKNVRSIYIKGPETVALPIYLTDELWVDKDKDIVADDSEQAKALLLGEKANIGKKRKSLESTTEEAVPATKKSKKSKPAKTPDSNDAKLDKEIADRKAALKKQKKAAKKALDV
ncbi:electron transfer flavoprotein alpha-subunit [Xylariaceae sp. FL1651]|nr:electron transfer flavoprotein alpha-subunit [Xylariaceae sp. FL1651]